MSNNIAKTEEAPQTDAVAIVATSIQNANRDVKTSIGVIKFDSNGVAEGKYVGGKFVDGKFVEGKLTAFVEEDLPLLSQFGWVPSTEIEFAKPQILSGDARPSFADEVQQAFKGLSEFVEAELGAMREQVKNLSEQVKSLQTSLTTTNDQIKTLQTSNDQTKTLQTSNEKKK